MATSFNSGSDSEFDFDFSPEEEQLLLQLASNTPAGATRLGESSLSIVIDSVPGKTDSVAGDDTTVDFKDGRDHRLGDRVASGPEGAEDVSRLPALSPPLPLHEDVSYPNRTSGTHKKTSQD